MIESALQKFALMGASWVLYLLLAMSIFSIGIICERALYFRSHSGDVEALGNELLRLLKVGDRRNAVALLQGSKSTEAAILLPAMDWLDGGAESVAEALESSLVKKRAELERGLTSLGTLGNNAPFVGLFGTVIGYNLSQKKVSTIENNVSVISKQILALLKADPKLLEQFAALSEEVAEEEAAAEVVGEPELG